MGLLAAKQERKAVLAATIGCGLEFYDFLTYAFFAIQIGQTFFPSHDPYLSLMGSLGAFGAGFVGRPLGAWILGGYGDRAGRKPAMLLSMTLMGLGIAVLALTPGYAAIGIAAPIIVTLARFVQGFALGGEIGSATIYMVEAGGIARRGRNASYQGICQGVAATLGALVGLALSALLTADELAAYGWRIALLLGVSIVPAALLMRRSLPETIGCAEPEFVGTVTPGPSYRQVVWCGAALMAAGTIFNYVENYMTTFGQAQLHLSSTAALAGQLAGNMMIIAASVAGGILADRAGRKPVLVACQFMLAVTILPALWLIATVHSLAVFFGVNLLLGLFNNVNSPALYVAVAESLEPAQRSRGFAMIYSLPITLFGGTTQLFVTWLLRVTGTPLALGVYLAIVGTIGLAAALLLPESAPHRRGWKPSPALATA